MEALQAQIKEYEKQKKLSQEKLKEEHAQLVSFQKKLTQAGSHLKTLAQQNATLNKKVEEQSHQLEEQNTRLKEQEEEHTVILQQRQKGHEKEVKQLVEVLEKATATNEESPPDVSNSTLLDNYVKSVQKRLITKKPNTGKTHTI